jgi:hypothetical protein
VTGIYHTCAAGDFPLKPFGITLCFYKQKENEYHYQDLQVPSLTESNFAGALWCQENEINKEEPELDCE